MIPVSSVLWLIKLLDTKMPTEVPSFRRWCSLPVGRSIAFYAYLKLILVFLADLYLVATVETVYRHTRHLLPELVLYYSLGFVFASVETVFTGILLFESPRLLRVSYIYSKVSPVVFILGDFFTALWHKWEGYATFQPSAIAVDLFSVAYVVCQIFVGVNIILLLRSETLELQNRQVELEGMRKEDGIYGEDERENK